MLISLEKISKSFKEETGKTVQALCDVSIDINEGEFFVLLGPSGCGKSTVLRIMSGLEKSFKGSRVLSPEISPRDFGFVFQSFALLPWLTIYENVALGLIARKYPRHEIQTIVHRELVLLGLEKFAHQYPKELSGGMRQRVGIARALAISPKVIFLDEPFSALDSFTADTLRKDLLSIWQERKITIIMVTHNTAEAIELGDRIAVMSSRPGSIKHIIENTLPRPRPMRSPEVFSLEDKIVQSVEKGSS